MKIRIAILEKDSGYLNRLTAMFTARYADKIELYAFTDAEQLFTQLETLKLRIDILLASDAYEDSMTRLSSQYGFAYLVDQPQIRSLNEKPAICKFQRVDMFYKDILNLYAELVENRVAVKPTDKGAQLIAFASPAGGAGASTLAAAYAMRLAASQYKVLYLNLETFGSTELYFSGEGQYTMSELVVALKSRKANLTMKLESSVRRDSACGVYFFAPTKIALDRVELEQGEIIRLVEELRETGDYDFIVVDMDFLVSREMMRLYSLMHSVVWVVSGTAVGNQKLERAYACLELLDVMDKTVDIGEVKLIYNKYDPLTGSELERPGLRLLGEIPPFPTTDVRELITLLAQTQLFDDIL